MKMEMIEIKLRVMIMRRVEVMINENGDTYWLNQSVKDKASYSLSI
jgi:hypothetical protein